MRHVKKKEGYIGVMFLLLAGIITPIVLFLVIDLTQSYSAKAKLQDTVDRMARAATYQVDEEALAAGTIHIVTTDAYDRSGLVETLDDKGLFEGLPDIAVTVNEDASPATLTGHQSTYTLEEAGVLVTGRAIAHQLFVPRDVPLYANAAYEVTFGEKEEKTYTGALPFGTIAATVINPLIYETDEEITSPDLHLAAGGDASLMLELPVVQDETVEVELVLIDAETLEETSLATDMTATFRVPEEMPVGSTLVVRALYALEGVTREEEAVIGEVTHQLKEALRIDRVTHD